ncbi:hypothetical protein L9G16_18275, partial [Shewanella sp. A25]|nr:hypothetical protein [Shewanella shenzhenensis]
MIIACFTLTLLVTATSAWRLEQFALTTDYDSFFDEILFSVLSQIPAYLPQPPMDFDVSKTNSSTPIAKFSCPDPMLGRISSAIRTSKVIYELGPGNLTLSTNLTFGNLMFSCPQSKVTVSDHEFNGHSSVTATTNTFQIIFTVYSKADGSCALSIRHAAFVVLDDIG